MGRLERQLDRDKAGQAMALGERPHIPASWVGVGPPGAPHVAPPSKWPTPQYAARLKEKRARQEKWARFVGHAA
jgi:hypothetical protein